jgi:L-malate glycosyltransferase
MPNGLKIAYLYDAVYPYVIGGVQKRVWELSKRLVQKGHDVTIIGMKYWDGSDTLVKDGVKILGACQSRDLSVNGRRSIGEAVHFGWDVLPTLLKQNYDIVDCQNFPYIQCFSAKLASLVKNYPLVITWHEVWGDYWFTYLGKKGRVGKVIEKLTSQLTENNVAVSSLTQQQLVSLGIKGYVPVVPNGINYEDISNITAKIEDVDILYTGRLTKEKNVELLVRAAALLKKKIPHIKCLIIGDGPEKDNLVRISHELGLGTNIVFKGFLEKDVDVISYMKASKVFVLPSIREGFGIVAIEANACGLPVIVVDHPQNAATGLIHHGKNGFICQRSEEDMANKILQALEDDYSWHKECVTSAQVYDWDQISDQMVSVYRQYLIGNGSNVTTKSRRSGIPIDANP